MQARADILELDVHLSADEHPIVFHDATLERTTNGSGLVAAKSLQELQTLDAGWGFKTPTGVAFFRGRGVKIPTLQEVVSAFPRAAFNIELKSTDPRLLPQVLKILKNIKRDQVLLTGGQPKVMSQLEAAAQNFPLGMSYAGIKDVLKHTWTWQKIPTKYRGRALQIPPRQGAIPVTTPRLIREAKAGGLEVHIWTINDVRTARRWLERGVDGVMTDDPGALQHLVHEIRLRRTPSSGVSHV